MTHDARLVDEGAVRTSKCHACERDVDRVRSSMWHSPHEICEECFLQWYDPDYSDVDPTSARSVGNATRRKLGMPLLPTKSKGEQTWT